MADQPNQNIHRLLTENPKRIYVIAEAGLNHGGNKERALALVRAAKWAGADAVKFQTSQTNRSSRKPAAVANVDLPFDAFIALYKEAKRLDIELFATPFDEESADFFDQLGVGAFKISPEDITRRSLIEHVAGKRKPMLLSTGSNNPSDIEHAIDWMHTHSNDQVVLLHGVAAYPAKHEDLNLRSVQSLRDRFGVPVGFSDHSVGTLGSTVATSLGAQVIERHFMIETRGDMPELVASMDAKTLRGHIEELRSIESLVERPGASDLEAESRGKAAYRRTQQAGKPAAKGTPIDAGMIRAAAAGASVSSGAMRS